MDTRRFIVAMLLSFAALYAWTSYNRWYADKHQPDQPQRVARAPATQPGPGAAQQSLPATPPEPIASTGESIAQAPAAPAGTDWRVQGAQQVKAVPIGEDTAAGAYYIQALLTNRGAAVEQVLMVKKVHQDEEIKYRYAKTVKGEQPYPLLEPLPLPSGEKEYSWQTAAVRIGDERIDLSDTLWDMEVTRSDKGVYTARFWVDLLRGDEPVARVEKHYTLAPATYAMDMGVTVRSLGEQPVEAVVEQLGPVGIRREDPRYDYRKIFVVVNAQGKPQPLPYTHSDVAGRPETVGSGTPLWWTALVDKYFAAITAPTGVVGANQPVARTEVFAFTNVPDPNMAGDVAVSMASPVLTATAAQPASLSYDLFLGPKQADVLSGTPAYVQRNYSLLRSAEYAWCTFSALGELLTAFLHTIYTYIPPHNYGIAIIILVLIVRVLLHPLTKHQQVAMSQMQQKQAALQPKIEAAKKKFANDKQKLQLEMMQIYREAGINPASQMAGCLPMLIQLPIWVALYSALNYDINLWHAPFALWINDLSAPDGLLTFAPVNIPLLSLILGPVDKLNVLPILLSASMYLQQKFMPKPKPMNGDSAQSEQQKQMQKMMGFMMLFMGLLFYNMPSGLNLYIMASSTFGIIEQIRIRKHIEERQNRPEQKKPARRNPWMEKIFASMEKKARDAHTVRKSKD